MPASDFTITAAPLTRAELHEAAAVSARAFHTDPFFEFLAPKAVPRARGLALYSLALCANLGPRARLLTARVDGRVVGVGAWLPPGAYPYRLRDQVAQGLGTLRALYRVPASITKGARYLLAIEKAHPKDELWYLQLLVCDPEHQRKGIGAALQAEVLETCDREGLPAYLETQKESNLA
ncbi:MAG TPA: GNAT family N-acetyltransferase, partial [Acidimicrobiales bacterium]|nr:GNAT family N-acetyltransferase [Acidimicrobiales bacterium]